MEITMLTIRPEMTSTYQRCGVKQKRNSKSYAGRVLAALVISVSSVAFALAADAAQQPSNPEVSEDKTVAVSTAAVSTVVSAPVSTAAVTAAEPVPVSTAAIAPEQVSDNRQIYDAITDLNYKIEYLKTGYNRTNADLEALRIAGRDLRKDYSDRISAFQPPDMSRVDKLEADSAQMRSEISQLRAEIAELKAKLANSARPAVK
jgi:hypothetical protein